MTVNAATPPLRDEAFHVPAWMHLLGGLISRHPAFWIGLGNLESRILAERLSQVRIDRPIFIAGLARAGTTVLLEIIASHRGVATHRYRDFPPIFTPFAWNWWLDRVPLKHGEPTERTHGDGIYVTAESPEAMEEVLWMTHFADAHDPLRSNVLDANTSNPGFESFYRDHIRKVLLARGGNRYASKENYNITRLSYLQKLFPDARFVIPIRRPREHVASLIKEHHLFSEGHRRHPRALEHFRRVGHFEFGGDLRPINTGDTGRVRRIQAMWARGMEVRGWAAYWAIIYDFVAQTLEADRELSRAALVVRFEDLCSRPEITLSTLYAHCGLSGSDEAITKYAGRLRSPTYYSTDFDSAELEAIEQETAFTRARFGCA